MHHKAYLHCEDDYKFSWAQLLTEFTLSVMQCGLDTSLNHMYMHDKLFRFPLAHLTLLVHYGDFLCSGLISFPYVLN